MRDEGGGKCSAGAAFPSRFAPWPLRGHEVTGIGTALSFRIKGRAVTRDVAIVVVAAGRGSRAGAGLPKQYRVLAGRPLIAHTLSALTAAAPDASLQVVIHPDDKALYEAAVRLVTPPPRDLRPPVYGASTRQASVRAGL